MDRSQIQELLEAIERYIPISKIEAELSMPKNTLQKALSEKEKRVLPKKWRLPFINYVNKQKNLEAEPKIKESVKKELPKSPKITTTMTWDEKQEAKKLFPKTLNELKELCPKELTGFERSQWIADKRVEYRI